MAALVLAAGALDAASDDGRLAAVSLDDGRTIEELAIPRPAWDGLAAAGGRLFLSTRGHRPIGVTTIRRLCEVLSRVTGVSVAPHMLRHTCATLLRQSGVPDRISMEQLGHSSLTVLQRYSHVTDGERRDVVERLDVEVRS